MKTISYQGGFEIIAIGMESGDLLLEGIQQAIKDHDIQNGIVLTGYGTLRKCCIHYISKTDIPPEDIIYSLEKPLEINAISGIIADGEPHLHILVNCGKTEAYGGHLEPGSEVAYLAEIAIMKCNDMSMIRQFDASGYIRLLQAKS